ncbi:hypothetical protein AB0F81_05690 [Actinoplanes sp. NPDC024001]|uniref:hypothetical protein n=1 Tax=Actinoplanes sp. NPDC024001 TaxID=3154598 RepID=UPI00340DC168
MTAMEPDAAVALIGDTGTAVDLRLAAIDAARFDATSHPEVIASLLAVLGNRADEPAVRRAALGALRENTFRVAAFRQYAPDYLNTLRGILDDPNQQLRERVVEVLALENDEYTQRRLLDGLENPEVALVAPQRALQLLGYDLHAEHYELLRDFAGQDTDPAARNTALRLLAADGASADLFARILQDRSQDLGARALSGVALSSLAPAEFSSVAEEIVLDDTDDDDLRATLLTALSHGTARPERADLAERVLAHASTPELTRAAEQYAQAAPAEAEETTDG